MDISVVTGISLLETAVLVGPLHVLSLSAIRTLLGFIATQYLAVLTYNTFVWPFYVSPLRSLPTPENNTFFLGQIINQFKGPSPNTEFVAWMNKWPDVPFIRYFSFANSEVLLVNSLAAHKQVLQTKCYSFEKPEFFRRLLIDITGKGLLFSDGDEHKSQRRQLIGPFSPPKIRKLLPVFREKTNGLLEHLDRMVQADESGTSCVVDLDPVFTKTTLDVIGAAALGVDFNDLSAQDTSSGFLNHYNVLFGLTDGTTLVTFLNAFIPLRWIPMELNRKYARAVAGIRTLLRGVYRQRVADMAAAEGEFTSEKSVSKDLLTFMLEARMSGEARWTEDEIVDHLVQFVTGGHETSATSLVLLTAVLAARPDCQERICQEIRDTIEKHGDLDALAIEGMVYLNNFIREVLRAYSPSIMVPRQAIADVEIEGVLVPKGTTLMIVPQVTHSNPRVWGKDADDFRPERWEHLEGDAGTPFALEAFINGPRVCPGKGFALLLIKTVLIELLGNFVLFPVDELSKFENPAFTLKPKGGLRIGVRKR